MLVCELFPELAKQILRDLRRDNRRDLAAQVMNLLIVDRCRCGEDACGTFYTQEATLGKPPGPGGTDIMLECGAILTETNGRITRVETLDPQVTDALRIVIP